MNGGVIIALLLFVKVPELWKQNNNSTTTWTVNACLAMPAVMSPDFAFVAVFDYPHLISDHNDHIDDRHFSLPKWHLLASCESVRTAQFIQLGLDFEELVYKMNTGLTLHVPFGQAFTHLEL